MTQGWSGAVKNAKNIIRSPGVKNTYAGTLLGAGVGAGAMAYNSDRASDWGEAGIAGAVIGGGLSAYGLRKVGKMTSSVSRIPQSFTSPMQNIKVNYNI